MTKTWLQSRRDLPGGRAWLKRLAGGSGLAARISARAISLTFVVLAVGGIVSFVVTGLLIREQLMANLRHEAQLAAQRVELEIGNVYEHVLAMAQNPLVSNSLTDTGDGRDGYLTPFLQNDVLVRQGATLALLDFAGTPINVAPAASTDAEVPPSTVAKVLQSGRPSAALVRRDGSGAYQLQILVPVHYPASGQAEGALLMQADLDRIATVASRESAQTVRFHALLAEAGTVLVGGELRPTLFEVRHPLRLGGPFVDRPLFLEVGVEPGSVLLVFGLWLGGYAAAGLVALLLVLAAVRRMSRRLTAPLARLTVRVDGIGDSGRLDFAWNYPDDDEIGRLGKSFQAMVERVARVQGELEYRVEERTRELQQSKGQLAYLLRFAQSTLDGLTAHICVLDDQGVIRSVNKAWREFGEASGAADGAVGVGVNYLDVCAAGAAASPEAARAGAGVRAVLEGESKLFEMEYACLTPRQPRWFRLRASCMADGVGGVVVAHEDITATKRAEAALQERNDQLDTLFASSPNGLLSVDQHGIVTYANPTFFRMTGIAPEAILNQPEECLDACLRGISDGAYPGLSWFCDPSREAQQEGDGEGRQLLTLSAPRQSVLAITGVSSRARTARKLFYFRDVTHEIEVDRMKSDFLATAAHELRTPMASIYGFTELLLSDEFDPATQRDLLQTIHQQTDLLVKIINELLDLVRIEARRGKDFRFERLAADTLVQRALAALAIDRGTWPVQVQVAPSVAPVWGDPDKLYQALLNVLSNAVKYSPAGGPIAIRILAGDGARAGQVGVAIRDAGIGMSAAHVARIFERFFRADTSGTIPGTGLGMPIVKEIIDLHRGEIVIESELGRGTEVCIWLPASGEPAPAVDADGAAPV